MSYLARLVQQTGLRVAAPAAPIPVQGQLPDLPDAGGDGIEEISVEVPASTMPRSPEVTQTPSPVPGAVPVIHQTAPKAKVTTPAAAIPAPARAPRVTPTDPILPAAAPRPTTGNERETPAGAVPAPDPQVQETITRHETLRQIFDWVAPNDRGPRLTEQEPPEPKPAPRPEAPAERAVYVTPKADAGSAPPERKIRASDDRPDQPPPPRNVQVIEQAAPVSPDRTAPPEPVEERIDISIGAINLSVEAPPRPAAPPVSALPAPPPASSAPSLPRAPLASPDRLRRRFVRL